MSGELRETSAKEPSGKSIKAAHLRLENPEISASREHRFKKGLRAGNPQRDRGYPRFPIPSQAGRSNRRASPEVRGDHGLIITPIFAGAIVDGSSFRNHSEIITLVSQFLCFSEILAVKISKKRVTAHPLGFK